MSSSCHLNRDGTVLCNDWYGHGQSQSLGKSCLMQDAQGEGETQSLLKNEHQPGQIQVPPGRIYNTESPWEMSNQKIRKFPRNLLKSVKEMWVLLKEDCQDAHLSHIFNK